jgi:ribosomal protein L9
MDLAGAMPKRHRTGSPPIKLAEPIKALGDYEVPIKLHTEVTAHLSVSVQQAE